jgi:hypothetical protein
MKIGPIVGASALFVSLAANPGLAQNLVANARFDTIPGLTGWLSFGSSLPSDGSRAWAAPDSGGAAGSGSALLTVTGTDTGTLIGLSQCIDISAQPAGSTYLFFSSVNTPAAQSAESRGVVELAFFSDAVCTTALNTAEGQGAAIDVYAPVGAPPWPTYPGNASPGGTEGSATAPPGALGAQVRIYLERTSGVTQQQVFFDHVSVHLLGTVPVTLLRFEAE